MTIILFYIFTEHRRQVLANLANFAYDPINYEFFRKLNILDLFLDILAEDTDDEMIEFAIGGICNCCLDELNKQFLTENDGIKIVTRHLSSCNDETVLSSLTTLMYLTTSLTKKGIPVNRHSTLHIYFLIDTATEYIVGTVKKLSKSSNKRLINLATIFIEVSFIIDVFIMTLINGRVLSNFL